MGFCSLIALRWATQLRAAIVGEDEGGEEDESADARGRRQGRLLGLDGEEDGGRPCLRSSKTSTLSNLGTFLDGILSIPRYVCHNSIAAARRQIFSQPVSSRRRPAKGKFHGGYYRSPLAAIQPSAHHLTTYLISRFLPGIGCVNLNGGAVPAT